MNQILHGDCLEVMKGLPSQSVDLVITDPPYSTPTISAFGRKKVCNLADLSIQEFYFRSIKRQFERLLKPDGRVFVFCDDKYYAILFGVFYDWPKKNLLIWDKGRIGMGYPFRRQHELIFYVNRQTFDYNKTTTTTHFSTILKFGHDGDRVHGSQKPLALIESLVAGFSSPGDTVFDPFVGSGTTCLAAKNLGRKYIGIELNTEYAEIAKARVQNKMHPKSLLREG